MKKTGTVLIVCILMIPILLVSAIAETAGERNALGSALNYLSFMNFSYDGLINQLEYEGYSDSECKYAANNCGADWFDQAAGSAESYLSFMSFSKSGLVNQLLYEGYTEEQANYGAAVAYGENPTKPGSAAASVSSDNTSEKSFQEKTAEASSSGKEDPVEAASSEAHASADIPRTDSGFDLSGLSYEDLLTLQAQVNLALNEMSGNSPKEVKVPVGTYQVGIEIPAGKWTITATDGMCEVYWGKCLDEYGVDVPYSDRIDKLDDWGTKSSVTWNLTEGTYIVVNRNAVTFTPYEAVTLGF